MKKKPQSASSTLHCIGSILYYTDVPDDDDPRWLLKGHVICLPQVIFDSISQLIIVSMQVVHDGGLDTEFVRAELIRKGQFSLEAIKRHCKLDTEVSKNLENKLLIPSGPLVKLLKYLNLLSEITHKDEDGERITYLMPAILNCASQEELTNPPQPDTNNPEPLHHIQLWLRTNRSLLWAHHSTSFPRPSWNSRIDVGIGGRWRQTKLCFVFYR